MGILPCIQDDGDEEDERNIEGPRIDRKCTDMQCTILFVGYLVGFLISAVKLHKYSDPMSVTRGRDYLGRYCGIDDGVADRKYTYYPDLLNDFKGKDGFLNAKYGICVDECPMAESILLDYSEDDQGKRRRSKWYVSLNSLPLAGRCIPYQDDIFHDQGVLCAWPKCDPRLKCKDSDDVVCRARKICGVKSGGRLQDDDTSHFWVIDSPRSYTYSHSRRLAGSHIDYNHDAFLKANKKTLLDACEVKVRRHVRLDVLDEEDVFGKLLTRYTGRIFRCAEVIFQNWSAILSLGLIGSLAWSMILISGFSTCFSIFVWFAVFVLFTGLTVTDYIFYVKAGVATGRTGMKVHNLVFADTAMNSSPSATTDLDAVIAQSAQAGILRSLQVPEDPWDQNMYKGAAICLSICIIILCSMACVIQKHVRVIVALAKEASRIMRKMPSLLLFPAVGIVSMAIFSSMFSYVALCIMTMRPQLIVRFGEVFSVDVESLQSDPDRVQNILLALLLFSFLWIWFFHLAVFTTTVAGSVSQWYYYRDDQRASELCHGSAVALAFFRTLRFHIGSLALGSFLVTLAKIPRIALHYLDKEMKQANAANSALQCLKQVADCCVLCFEKCLQFMTNLAYHNIAVTGKSFCPAARASFALVVKYPLQMALDMIASNTLYWIAVLIVPTISLLVSYGFVRNGWGICALFIVSLSVNVASVAVSIFDTCITTLFICAVRDEECFGGIYAPESLREAMQMPPRAAGEEKQSWPEGIELADTS